MFSLSAADFCFYTKIKHLQLCLALTLPSATSSSFYVVLFAFIPDKFTWKTKKSAIWEEAYGKVLVNLSHTQDKAMQMYENL